MKRHFCIADTVTVYPWVAGNFLSVNLRGHFDEASLTTDGTQTFILNADADIPEALNALAVPDTERLFAVVDNNRAHHVSKFLADFAMAHTGIDTCTVLNIDQHLDYYAAGTLQCGTWGQAWRQGSANRKYISFCNKYAENQISKHTAPGVKPNPNPLLPPPNPENGFTSALDWPSAHPDVDSGLIGNLDAVLADIENIYITIDLDVLTGSNRTSWPQGRLPLDSLYNLISRISHAVEHGNLNVIGADVTGLPTHLTAGDTLQALTADANAIITAFLDALRSDGAARF